MRCAVWGLRRGAGTQTHSMIARKHDLKTARQHELKTARLLDYKTARLNKVFAMMKKSYIFAIPVP